jgi:UDP-N-acetylglucosamine--N-acetylmuramyl-(pentapeptide) pyrophosphoryl-undecaprenol N-acetylglucosamine transferase
MLYMKKFSKDKMKPVTIAVTGGGSGGHTMPAVAMIETLRAWFAEQSIELKLLYIGSFRGLEKNIATDQGIPYYPVATGKLRRYFSWQNLTDLFLIGFSLIQSFFLLFSRKPDLLFSTGGFVSVPPVISAGILRIPVVIHEQTIDAGLANKIASRFADRICLTFEDSAHYFKKDRIRLTGIPQREALFSGNKTRYLASHPFDPGLPFLFFTGGGLGCHILNVTALQILPELLKRFNIIYQSGNAGQGEDYRSLEKMSGTLPDHLKNRFQLFNFIGSQIGDIYACADLVISRSGAGTVNELLSLHKPAVFIPLAIAAGQEQLKNAQIMAAAGAAVIIEEKDLSVETLRSAILNLFEDHRLDVMKNILKERNQRRGNEAVLEVMLELLKKRGKL